MKIEAKLEGLRNPVATPAAQSSGWERVLQICNKVLRLSRRPARRLRLCESLPLGERRFVAVVEFEEARFLVGGTSGSLVLLARLGDVPDERAALTLLERAGITVERPL